ncbi:carbon-nitrogen hydrolase family protein [Alkalimarinus alittae]|uniref:Carbon-nitrogen hydrolase family protein n=1 Tax=Alkalimarinus alittae TaxID=2961619 RepID=A0ABY6N284_9ALTE|nr:carbon-nitrogen hydrolase family protein [Alkalimarinus alittae]UZE96201.1 carbon-nitrogen hydrolase family protein [Alkalimarinus alittae]
MTESTELKQKKIIAAAIQLEATTGDVSINLERAESLSLEAISKGARVIALPEFFTARVAFKEDAYNAVLPPDNEAVNLLKSIAARHDCWIGGSMLIADGGEVYNRYHFVEPDGTTHHHDKDLPTMWERAFYAPGNDDGVFNTPLGGVGAAVCWELIRTQTLRRLIGKIDIAMTGSHWWTMPNNWGEFTNQAFAAIAQYNRYLSENAPGELARRLGVPVLHASHCGQFSTDFMLMPGVSKTLPYNTEFVGGTQIVDGYGHVLAYRQAQEGPGIVMAEISPGAIEPRQETHRNFWLPGMPLAMKLYWHQQNVCGKSYYRKKGRQMGIENARRIIKESV